MLRPRRYLAFCLVLVVGLPLLMACVAQSPVGGARVRSDPFGRGINFGNALEAPVEGDWGLTLLERHVAAVADAGFRTVRLPVKWSAHAASEAPYAIDPAFLARVDEVVGWILGHGLQVIVNVHHYDEMASEPEAHVARWLAIWRQLSEHYQGAPDALAFELLNEPNGALSDALWNSMVQQALAVVRATNPTRLVVVGPTQWNAISALPGLELPVDDHLVVTVHTYDPFGFTHQGAEWVDPPPPIGRTWTGTLVTPTAGWQDWSWGTARAYGTAVTLTYEAGWTGFYLQASEPAIGYAHLALRTSRALELLVLCGADDGDAVRARTEAGVELRVATSACGGAAGVPRVILQNGTDRAQPPFVLDMLELRGAAGTLPLIVTEAEAIEASFEQVRTWAEANGGPAVLVGEFGAYGAADLASRVRWTRAVRDAAEARGFGWAYWEFGAGFGAFDPVTNAWRAELLEALVGD